MKILLRKHDRKNSEIICRSEYHQIKKNAHYVTVIGEISGGAHASFPMCLEHSKEFFKGVTKVKREITKITGGNNG